jgi:FMN reductase
VERILAHLEAGGASTKLIDLVDLSAEALLGRRKDASVDRALQDVGTANIIVLGTPIYRASYAGQLKAFFDLFPQDVLVGRVVGLVATGAGSGHLLAIDHGLRPLVASLKGLSAAQALYVSDSQFPDKLRLPDAINQQARLLASELVDLARAVARSDAVPVEV